jgi:hypothetical protein
MKVQEIQKLAERRPFRPFGIRLNNGAQYTFKDPKDIGAPRDYREIFYFGESDWVLIDTDSITEVFTRQ